ncbi:MAG: DUF4157 domain-containing protein, partial [Bacteroidota bacterium]
MRNLKQMMGNERKPENQHITLEDPGQTRVMAPPPFQLQASSCEGFGCEEEEMMEAPMQMKEEGEGFADAQPPADDNNGAAQPNENPAETPSAPDDGLPTQLKAGIESLSGEDMSDVKVHHNSSQPAQLKALAYAQGTDIHLGPGQEQHLAHEAWHVVQQKQGRVEPTRQLPKGGINDDPALEHEADVMGAKAESLGASLNPADPVQKKHSNATSTVSQLQAAPIQLMRIDEEIRLYLLTHNKG